MKSKCKSRFTLFLILYLIICLQTLRLIQKNELLFFRFQRVDETFGGFSLAQASPPLPILFLPVESPDQSIITSLRNDLPQGTYNELTRRCQPTCQIQVIRSSSCAANSAQIQQKQTHQEEKNTQNEPCYWEIQSLNCRGEQKQFGGDEFYVTFEGKDLQNGLAVAWVTDLQNGRYSLDFRCSPLNNGTFSDCQGLSSALGTLTIYLQYSCQIGKFWPPYKDSWKNGGNIVRMLQYPHLLSAPPVRVFSPPTFRPNMSMFDDLIPLGDSLMQQFLQPVNISLPNIGNPLTTNALAKWFSLLQQKYGYRLQYKATNNIIALITGSSAWDLLSRDVTLQDLQDAFHILISNIKLKYPHVHIFWKSPTAMHIHVPMMQINKNASLLERQYGKKKFYERLRYMSASRSYELYEAQKEWCLDPRHNVTFLDVYEASYLQASETRLGDGRHYTERFNTMIVNWFT